MGVISEAIEDAQEADTDPADDGGAANSDPFSAEWQFNTESVNLDGLANVMSIVRGAAVFL